MTTASPCISKNELRASILKDSFFEFVKYFWDVIIVEEPVYNWHIEYICDEMQKIAERVFKGLPKEYDLVINIPPGSTKTSICSIFFPSWVWIRMISCRSICGSYSSSISLSSSRKCRNVIKSEKYAELFPIEFAIDQDAKGHFANINGGFRYSTSVGGGVTGEHAHFLLVDDPLNPQEAASEADLKTANDWLKETLPSRVVNKKITPTILIMQRLTEGDPTDLMLSWKRVRHINLPAEINLKDPQFKNPVRPRSLIRKYKPDPDKEGYLLLDPIRGDREILDDMEMKLGDYAYAGQFLQRPVPPEGGMFKTQRIHIEEHAPFTFVSKVRGWDKAGTEGGGCYTVGVLLGEDQEGRFWILDVVRDQLDTGEREKLIKQIAEIDGTDVIIAIEQEPGSGGKESAQGTVRNLKGFAIDSSTVTGSKESRAKPFSSQVNVGNVWMVKAEWNLPYINELTMFPNSKYKDQVDATSRAFSVISFGGRIGVL
jgi:predicted phage terminase large subunit-like protein